VFYEGFTVTGDSNNIRVDGPSLAGSAQHFCFTDALIKTAGRHTITAGIDLMHQFAEEYTQYPSHPEVTFTALIPQRNGRFPDGVYARVQAGRRRDRDVAGWQFAPFVQDDWKYVRT